MVGLPGLAINQRGESWIDPDEMMETLEELQRLSTGLFFLLTEDKECPHGMRLALRERLSELGSGFVALPIADFAAPSSAWVRGWNRLWPRVAGVLDNGGSVGFCCAYGAGRSGMIAAHTLSRRGLSVDEALRRVRDAFAEAVESPEQEHWLLGHDDAKEGHALGGYTD
ncbi:hypothetical protein [Mesorhizobium sp. ANAO-SY3R2]|uniref:protein-tyrosine phosphatase family protein n=1 Tax=Mesorhizobium sp. ANAO-SY3R2 TaxID=3166644 RepID=UPI00366D2635